MNKPAASFAPRGRNDIPFGEDDFRRIAAFAKSEYGLHLEPSKKAMIHSRLGKRIATLQLDGFKAQLADFEPQLRDPEMFPAVIQTLFEIMAGHKIDPDEMARINAQRRPDQDVVLGIWDMILTSTVDEIAAVVDTALAEYGGKHVPYLSLFGIDPGPAYADWIASYIAGAVTEVWADHGHYPHLVEPDRFLRRLDRFWS